MATIADIPEHLLARIASELSATNRANLRQVDNQMSSGVRAAEGDLREFIQYIEETKELLQIMRSESKTSLQSIRRKILSHPELNLDQETINQTLASGAKLYSAVDEIDANIMKKHRKIKKCIRVCSKISEYLQKELKSIYYEIR